MRYILVLLFAFLLNAAAFAGGSGALRKGNNAYDKEKYGEAFEYYNKAVESGEGEKGAYNAAAALYRLKDYDGALSAYETLGESETFKQDAAYNAANAYFEKGKTEQAIESLRRALLLKRDDKEALHNLQFLLKEQQNQENKQDKNNNQGNNEQQQDNQDNSDNQDKSGNQNQDEQQNQSGKDNQQDKDNSSQGEQQQQPQLSRSEADNILKMSKEHTNEPPQAAAAAAGDIDKDW